MSEQLKSTVSRLLQSGVQHREWSRGYDRERSSVDVGRWTDIMTTTPSGYLLLSRWDRRFHKPQYEAKLYVVDTIYRDGSRSYKSVDSMTTRDPQSELAQLCNAAEECVVRVEEAKRNAHDREVAARRDSAYSELGGL